MGDLSHLLTHPIKQPLAYTPTPFLTLTHVLVSIIPPSPLFLPYNFIIVFFRSTTILSIHCLSSFCTLIIEKTPPCLVFPNVCTLGQPSQQPTQQPSMRPSMQPSTQPSRQPSSQPSMRPSCQPSRRPSSQPSNCPSRQPSRQPTMQPTRCVYLSVEAYLPTCFSFSFHHRLHLPVY